ncbi:MAG: hypothetical protein QOE06_82 [Thermoleophilaceae bacterium]|nr:hypothetical protein [Thermoleophilaceae bacterium]
MTMIRDYAPVAIVLVVLSIAIGVLRSLYDWGHWTLLGVVAVELFLVMGIFERVDARRGPYRRA